MENPLYKTEKLIGHHFRQVIKTGFVERQPYRNKCQHREKALTAVSGLFWAGTGQIKKSNSDLMWHPALFQYPERSSSFLEAASSSSAPEGRGEQQDRAPVSQHVSQGDATPREERGALAGHSSVSPEPPAATPQQSTWCCPPFCTAKGKARGDAGFTCQMCGWGGKIGLVVTREFQNSTAIDFTEKMKKNEEKWKCLWFTVVPSLLLASSGSSWENKIFLLPFAASKWEGSLILSASNVAASQPR